VVEDEVKEAIGMRLWSVVGANFSDFIVYSIGFCECVWNLAKIFQKLTRDILGTSLGTLYLYFFTITPTSKFGSL
jgi:hypothetical protein